MKRFVATLIIVFSVICHPMGIFAMYQDLYGGLNPQYYLSDDDAAQGYVMDVHLEYWFDHYVGANENIMLKLDAGPKFLLMKTEVDDERMNRFEFYARPEVKWTFIEKFSLAEVIGLDYLNEKIVNDDEGTDRASGLDVSSETTLQLGKVEEYLPGFSPWEKFKKGFEAKAIYTRYFYSTYDGEQADELDHSIGVEATYAIFHADTAFMIAPVVTVTKHLNDAVDERLEIGGTIELAKDVTEILTVDAEIGLVNIKPDADTDAETDLNLKLDLVLNTFEKLEISFNGNYWNNLSDDESDPIFGVGVDFNYEIFVKDETLETSY